MMKKFMESIEKSVYEKDKIIDKSNLHKIEINFEDDFNKRFYDQILNAIDKNEKSKSKLFDTSGDHSFLLSGSHLPSKILKAKKRTSLVSDYFIRGYPFILEDGKTYINHNEAFEWSIVFGFSPLMNGNRLNPF